MTNYTKDQISSAASPSIDIYADLNSAYWVVDINSYRAEFLVNHALGQMKKTAGYLGYKLVKIEASE